MAQLFEVVTGPMEGITMSIEGGVPLSIGRSSQNDITLPFDPWVSSSHATLKNKGGVVYVMDLHSSNGSYVQNQKIEPDIFVPLQEYLVVGSTLCRVGHTSVLTRKPLSVKKSMAKGYLANKLVRDALRIARDRRSPTLSVLHLFMASLKLDDPELGRLLYSLKTEAESLYARLDKLSIFSGSQEWINDFLIYQYKTKGQTDCYITPLTQDYIDRFSEGGNFGVVSLVKQMMDEPYNILHPALGIQGKECDGSLAGHTEDVNINAEGKEQIILPKSFWNSFREALDGGKPVILSGSEGTGKTAVLKECFRVLPKGDMAHFHKSEKRIFDPELFLTFHEISELPPYVDHIIKQMGSAELIAVDHFGFLLQLMEYSEIEISPLINLIRRRLEPTILNIRSEHLEKLCEYLPDATILRLDDSLKKVAVDILKKMQHNFERDVHCPISDEARHFLDKELQHRYNLAAIKAFFQFCKEKIQPLSVLYPDSSLALEKKEKMLSKTFFQTSLNHWASPFQATDIHRHPALTKANTPKPNIPKPKKEPRADITQQDQEMLAAIEAVLRRFLQQELRTELVYSDGRNSLSEHHPSAKTELATYLEKLLGSFGEGFAQWLETFLRELDPSLKSEEQADRRWAELVSWFEDLDRSFLKNHFMEMTRKTLKRALRQRNISITGS